MTIGLGPLEPFLERSDVFEVMVTHGREIWIEDREGIHHVGNITPTQLDACVEFICRSSGRRIDLMAPVLDGRLIDGTRACIVVPPIAVHGISINLRKFSQRVLPLAAFGSQQCTSIVRSLIQDKKNVVVSGETSSGKTSLLSAISHGFTANERVICIEDTHELRLAHSHAIHLQTRLPNQEGGGEITMQQLVRTSLRMRPDRLIIGEVRGAEAIDMILAMTTGHRGCWSSVHAHSASDTVTRLSNIIVREAPQWTRRHTQHLVHNAIDAVVHMTRQQHGRRRISEIVLYQDNEQHTLFSALSQRSALQPC